MTPGVHALCKKFSANFKPRLQVIHHTHLFHILNTHGDKILLYIGPNKCSILGPLKNVLAAIFKIHGIPIAFSTVYL